MYNFDKIIDRSETNSIKWDPATLKATFDVEDVLPLWVADMDFEVPPAIKEAVVKTAEHGIYGYSGSDKHTKAFIDWSSRRHDWQIEPDWILNTPGVVTAFNLAIQTFTEPGDNVIIQRPVYYPFTEAIENNGRHVSSNSLVLKDGKYEVDFEDFEAKAQDPNTTMFLLCSPHNPVSRVFTEEELTRMMDICIENNVLVVSDEIHNDLILPGYQHSVLANINEEFSDHVITCMSPSKSFNLAGMQISYIVISNPEIRRKYARTLEQVSLGISNPFAIEASTAAYNDSEAWLEELLNYLEGNFNYLKDYLAKELPEVHLHDLEATYLAWVDFKAFNFTVDELEKVIFNQAKVGLNGGNWFGPEGEGFMRINLACPRAIVEKAAEAIVLAVKEVKEK